MPCIPDMPPMPCIPDMPPMPCIPDMPPMPDVVSSGAAFCSSAGSSSSSLASSGILWATPLWQSMQVSPRSVAFECLRRANLSCSSRSMCWSEWQLRHSRESVAFILAHTAWAIPRRCASYFSGVSIVPMISWNTSFAAMILA